MEGLEEAFLAVSSIVDFPEGQRHEFPSSSWECSLPRVCGFPSPCLGGVWFSIPLPDSVWFSFSFPVWFSLQIIPSNKVQK